MGAQAGSLLKQLGYQNLAHYGGGIKEWAEKNEHIASSPQIPPSFSPLKEPMQDRFISMVGNISFARILCYWFIGTAACGAVYWLSSLLLPSLVSSKGAIAPDLNGFLEAMYFSFITALTIGYGDIAPIGPMRIFAIFEGAMGLLVFGIVISKLVSKRQEELLAQIHQIAFEERIGRIRSNLHTVLAEMQNIERLCKEEAQNPIRLQARIESSMAIFIGELKTIHELLYNPKQAPETTFLKAILATLASTLDLLDDILKCNSQKISRSITLNANLHTMSLLLLDFCHHCIPPIHANELKDWMERIEFLSKRFTQ